MLPSTLKIVLESRLFDRQGIQFACKTLAYSVIQSAQLWTT